MKTKFYNLGSLAVLGVMLLTTPITLAQTSTTTTMSTTSAGTISQFSPDTIAVKTTTSPSPVSFSYTKTTTYVDENGNPVSIETVKSGLPVTVYYNRDGDRMVASKVVVRRTLDSEPVEATTTRTTTSTQPTAGTISEFNPDSIVVRSDSSSAPVSYSYTKSTTYVDENGNPVSIETVKSGLPVTVFYDTEDGKMVATKVVVRRSTTTRTVPNP